MTDRKRPETAADVAAWCELLGLVRDEAKTAGEDFLAYLTGVALSHATTLSHRRNGQEPAPRLGSQGDTGD
jgi:hypothetical protein